MNVLNPSSIVRCICSEARAHVHVEKHLCIADGFTDYASYIGYSTIYWMKHRTTERAGSTTKESLYTTSEFIETSKFNFIIEHHLALLFRSKIILSSSLRLVPTLYKNAPCAHVFANRNLIT